MNDAIIINNKKIYTIDGINIRIHANLLYLFLHNIFNIYVIKVIIIISDIIACNLPPIVILPINVKIEITKKILACLHKLNIYII